MGIIDDLKLQYRSGGIAIQLIFWNIGAAIVYFMIGAFFKPAAFSVNYWLLLSSSPSELIFKPWTLFTYAFLHGSLVHLIFNLLMLNFASRLFLTFFTQKQFLGLYILAAVFSGLIFVLAYFLFKSTGILIGASGAIMGIMIAAAAYAPLYQVRLFLFGIVKLWHIAAAFLVIDLIQLPADNMGGHIAHLGGAFFGFLYIKLLKGGTDLSAIITSSINFFVTFLKPRKALPFKKVHKNAPRPRQKPTGSIAIKDKTQQQIDEILDKISRSGYGSLTKEEKEFLFRAGR
ncbi:MAG TPA: rhomboid family intramembrane serine protease [Flavobacterium sp.]|nr:rhomboid family intramembrane serine protease [Flavobacterium sp.]